MINAQLFTPSSRPICLIWRACIIAPERCGEPSERKRPGLRRSIGELPMSLAILGDFVGSTKEPVGTVNKRAESREPRAESREPRAESREPRARAESREPRAESREPRAESREPRAESREPRAESREPRAESREPRAESREPRAESREPRAESESREPRAESREPRAESSVHGEARRLALPRPHGRPSSEATPTFPPPARRRRLHVRVRLPAARDATSPASSGARVWR